ncbi:hypothetical protein WDV76_20795 [Xenorhabdus griffiniae]|uniref:hypothetical protein n=1 Tax=Xenorhabdus griffiniae TaxID=351672 RepID=UPI0030CFDA2A
MFGRFHFQQTLGTNGFGFLQRGFVMFALSNVFGLSGRLQLSLSQIVNQPDSTLAILIWISLMYADFHRFFSSCAPHVAQESTKPFKLLPTK